MLCRKLLALSAVSAGMSLAPAKAIATESLASVPQAVSASPLVAQAQAVPQAGQQTASPASQIKGLYITGALGGNWPQQVNVEELTNTFGETYGFKDYSYSGVSGEVGIGYDFGDIRAEVTYAYDGSKLKNYTDQDGSYDYTAGGDVSKNSIFASGYWDINLKSRLTPYIGAGIGYSNLRVAQAEDLLFIYSGYNPGAFAYQVKAGLSYRIDRRSDAFVEALYRGMAGYNVTDTGVTYQYANYNSWGFQLGARIRLGR